MTGTIMNDARRKEIQRAQIAYFVGDVGRKWIEADMIAGPAPPLEGRTFSAASNTACASTQLVA
jgi:hypothetical protein